MGTSRRSGKSLLINKDFQLRVVGFFGLLFIINSLILGAASYYFFYRFYQLGENVGLSKTHVFFRFLSEQEAFFIQIFTMSSILTFTLLLIGGLWLSHKVAGPLHKLKEHFKECEKEGKLKRVSFRKGDFFLDVQDSHNQMASRLGAEENVEDETYPKAA